MTTLSTVPGAIVGSVLPEETIALVRSYLLS